MKFIQRTRKVFNKWFDVIFALLFASSMVIGALIIAWELAKNSTPY